MVQINVYLLSDDDCTAIININRTKPRGPQIIICDYGLGCCVEDDVINNVSYAQWKTDLEAITPFASRSTVVATIDENN